MPKPDYKRIAERLNATLADARLSSQDLAARAGVDRKTVDRLRAGHAVRAQTLQWIEQALGVDLGGGSDGSGELAPARAGGYHRDAVAELAGEYRAFRRSFDHPDRVIASFLEIVWDNDGGGLKFSESQDNRLASGQSYAYRFGGEIRIPPNLGIMNFVVQSDDGRVRLISTSMPREVDGSLMMRGFILTLNELRDIGYYPVTSPIFLARLGGRVPPDTGVIESGTAHYAWAAAILDDIREKFLPPEGPPTA